MESRERTNERIEEKDMEQRPNVEERDILLGYDWFVGCCKHERSTSWFQLNREVYLWLQEPQERSFGCLAMLGLQGSDGDKIIHRNDLI
jgi:hypothetical protein